MERSSALFERAKGCLVGGVNSPVRAFKHVGGTPPFIKRAKGAYVWDEDGNKYIDYVGSWGPMVLGHGDEKVIKAIKGIVEDGLSFGAPCELEITLAELVKEAFPSIELVRFTNSGTEAVMGAIRAARGFTGRDNIIKFDGCYHGGADYLLVKAGSGALTCGAPDSAGVPADFARHTLVARYNDIGSVEKIFKRRAPSPQSSPSPVRQRISGGRGEGEGGGDIAAVIVEPVAGNMGCVPPAPGFLEGLRGLCDEHGALLIFDEVMTGFRERFGGVQGFCNIKSDLTCLGKVIGGGLPVGAYGGRRDIMGTVAPMGPVYQAGTFSGNPVTMFAGIETLKRLKHLERTGGYKKLAELTTRLVRGLSDAMSKKDIPHLTTQFGSMWTLFFSSSDVISLDDAMMCDRERFKRYFHAMLERGIYLAPSPYESGFVSFAHTKEDIEQTIKALDLVDLNTHER
jgi:glutamate-1-semialdehyde 2,1-aminomutase